MLWSQTFIPTLRDDPADAVIDSHKLMLRAGFIRQLTAGIYNYLPLMQCVIHKIERIVREEMNAAGAIEITMPVLHPAELWQKSGRWDVVGKEQMRMKDRHQRDLVLGGTHEEVITWIVRGELRSYRQLPKNFYQIQTKFRDEPRPRFGLMRGREFIMKDAYTFDATWDGLKNAYNKMAEAYFKIFRRIGFDVRMVESDVGAMGGTGAHEFMVPVETSGGENVILSCERCDYAANIEKATSLSLADEGARPEEPRQKEMVFTPGMKTVEEVTGFLRVGPEKLVKTLLYEVDGEVVAALIRGDREINEVKLKNYMRANELVMAAADVVMRVTGAQVGFAGPIGLSRVRIIADPEVKRMRNFVVGANRDDTHIINVNTVDFTVDEYAEIRQAQAGEICPRCNQGRLQSYSGIEVGNLFMLGTKYSDALGANFIDSDGVEKPFVMGSYGIGITRTAQAAVEAFHDEKGIIWPKAIAPYDFHIVPIEITDRRQREVAFALYEELQERGYAVLMDDREERPGVKFNDADLIGIPVRISFGDRSLKDGQVEIVKRRGKEMVKIPVEKAVDKAIEIFGQL
ncbi:MAG: proline--tRNA ligase [candidate division Zixibacteria bacterium RBG_16_53_22]|nr:MAG: proline--tRNA ligase [candidate division Zixibacteria bacterium RBG_16_53_22]